ncbi:cell division protein ZapE [Roseitranquillus sediminis]|uniref:cell division protein ZapE n=1 Tax=Roseitranquillus sediminis TaxID=2809051 RepID=UPI001D0C90A9|nr:cell division protein ZapE [Roseitranquillus sediminis]MBM9593214.1 AFG1 family ATPase [Roseitranquillus sediminis]
MGRSVHDLYDARVAQGLADDPAQRAVLDRLEKLREWIETAPPRRSWFRRPPDPPRGLYLWGGVGRGKSMLMDLLHEAAGGTATRRVHFHAFMQEVQAALHEARKTGVDDAIAPVAADIAEGLRLLLFDEMQITDIADAMIVGRLFQRLFDAGVVAVATSNRPPRDLYKDGLNRQLFVPFIELIERRMEVAHLAAATDYRQGRGSGERRYFAPADAEARAALDAVWEELAGGEGTPHRLRVHGREVELPLFHDRVARAPFWALCGRPLGPADYLAVAEACRALILEGVPRLSSENYNEAKRFVTLIDALYEAKVVLYVSAADTPDNLYIEGEGAFEFARTASRLHEMQSAGWGERRC